MAKADDKKTDKTVAAEKKTDDGKLKALGLAMDQITKQFGDGSIMKLGEAHKVDVEVIPSGSLSLDLALGSQNYENYVSTFLEMRKKKDMCLTS